MTELVRYEPPAALVSTRDTVDGWVAMIQPVAQLANEIALTDFVPATLRGKPAAITAAILAGREIGLGPIQSLQHMHVIDGRPAVSAEIARALSLAQGHEIHIAESTTTRCVVRGRRRNAQEWVTVTWSMDDAKRAGIDGKTNWRRHPRRMLQARATGELCHVLFSDAIGGMPFTVEEAEDDSDAAGQIVNDQQAAAPAKRTAQRRTRPAEPPPEAARPVAQAEPPQAASGPPLPGEPGYDEPPAVAKPEMRTDGQSVKIHALLNELGYGGADNRAAGLMFISTVIEREIDSTKKLTKAEAGALIDTLERLASLSDPQGAIAALMDAADATDRQAESGQADG